MTKFLGLTTVLYSFGVRTLKRRIRFCSVGVSSSCTASSTRLIRNAGRRDFQAGVTTLTTFILPIFESDMYTLKLWPFGITLSTACAIFALESFVKDFFLVFAVTGLVHSETYKADSFH